MEMALVERSEGARDPMDQVVYRLSRRQRVDADGEQIDERDGNGPGQQPRQAVAERQPVGDIAAMALGEEEQRQMQDLPHRPAARRNAEPRLKPREGVLPQEDQKTLEACDEHDAADDPEEPVIEPADQIVIDGAALQPGDRETDESEQESGEHGGEDR